MAMFKIAKCKRLPEGRPNSWSSPQSPQSQHVARLTIEPSRNKLSLRGLARCRCFREILWFKHQEFFRRDLVKSKGISWCHQWMFNWLPKIFLNKMGWGFPVDVNWMFFRISDLDVCWHLQYHHWLFDGWDWKVYGCSMLKNQSPSVCWIHQVIQQWTLETWDSLVFEILLVRPCA